MALLIPLLLAAAGSAFVSGAERAGGRPLAGVVARNSAEAAGLGRAAEMLRFLRRGDDPHRVYDVRPEILSSAIRRATTLEAAMWSRQLEMVQLLAREGTMTGEAERRELACLALDLGVEDVVHYLAPAGTSYCMPGVALQHVMDRTQ